MTYERRAASDQLSVTMQIEVSDESDLSIEEAQ